MGKQNSSEETSFQSPGEKQLNNHFYSYCRTSKKKSSAISQGGEASSQYHQWHHFNTVLYQGLAMSRQIHIYLNRTIGKRVLIRFGNNVAKNLLQSLKIFDSLIVYGGQMTRDSNSTERDIIEMCDVQSDTKENSGLNFISVCCSK